MSREWKPGDVAMVGGRVCIRMGNGMWEHGQSDLFAYADDPKARHLVVIDPEEQGLPIAHAIWEALADCSTRDFRVQRELIRDALREFANPTPPKPDEPLGLGAVVEDVRGWLYVRTDDADCVVPWSRNGDTKQVDWVDVPAVKILSEGVVA